MIFGKFFLQYGRTEKIGILLIIYVLYLFVFTLMPFTFSLDPSRTLHGLYELQRETLSSICCLSPSELFQNVILFMPFGFLFVTLPIVSAYPFWKKLMVAACFSCALSAVVEFWQIFLPRTPSIVDVLLNTLGGLLGALIGIYGYRLCSQLARSCWLNAQRSRLLPLLVMVYVVALFYVASLSILGTDFSNWDQTFPFQLGNEASLDRPWIGTIYLVAIYDRALSQEEIHSHFRAGPLHTASSKRARDGLVALYTFTQGKGKTIRDQSAWGPPLDLYVQDLDKVAWIHPNGIEFLDSTIIRSAGSAEKLCYSNMCVQSTLSAEVWMAPTNIEQKGPARIISYSENSELRNFTLGQKKRNIGFRLRTPLSGLNGMQQALWTEDDPLTTGIQHIVVTYDKGIATLYLNGENHAALASDGRDHLTLVYSSGKWAFWFVALFPVGFLAYMIFSRIVPSMTKALMFSAVTGMTVLAGMELVSMFQASREMDVSLLLVGTGVVFFSALASATFHEQIEVG
jgi:glycopeptide antibiotics resistance protein